MTLSCTALTRGQLRHSRTQNPALQSGSGMNFSDVSVVIPWRSEDPQRIKVWEHCKSEWETLGVEVCAEPDTDYGPFNTAKAANNAFKTSTRRYVYTMGADIIPDFTMLDLGLLKLKDEGLSWIPMGNQTEYFGPQATDRILTHKRWWDEEVDPACTVPFQTGVMLMKRELYAEAGGHDERFTGWGGEDAAFRRAIHLLGGDSDPLSLSLRCLWHDPSRRQTMSPKNFELCDLYHDMHTRQEVLDYVAERGSFV